MLMYTVVVDCLIAELVSPFFLSIACRTILMVS